jgi:hypothetical protein
LLDAHPKKGRELQTGLHGTTKRQPISLRFLQVCAY